MPLQQAPLGEANRRISGHHEVIKRPHIDECERLFERLSQQLVGSTRFGHSRRVVVREDDGGRVVRERSFHDFARKNAGLAQRPPEHFFARDEPMLRIQEQHDENLVLQVGDPQTK